MFEDDPMLDETEESFDDDEDRVIEDVFLGHAAEEAWEWATDDNDLY